MNRWLRLSLGIYAAAALSSLVAASVVEEESIPAPALAQKAFFPDIVCFKIAQAISLASDVYYLGDPLYEKGLHHYAKSSTELSKCVVEAGTPEDVGKILVILGETHAPFAVKGGGHSMNPGFSSTPHVHISMYRFSEINYDPESETADIGAGLIWDDVYATLEPFGVNVLGARVTGVGVAGFTLGGGYSWKANQYGLAIDSILAFQLVQPSGHVITVTNSSDPQLFFGLKGGMNNFGVVTKFTMKTYPQTQVWGGSIYNLESELPDVAAAAVAFQTAVTDPKAALILTYSYVASAQQVIATQMLFYDAPTPPPGIFDAFLAIPSVQNDVKTRSFLSLIHATPSNSTMGARTVYQGFPLISLTDGMASVLFNESKFWGQALADKSQVCLSYSIELFLPSIYSHNPDKTAFPPSRDIFFQPFTIGYTWNSPEFDADFHLTAILSSEHILKSAIEEDQTDLLHAPNYPNYAITGTPLEDMYGENVPALRRLRARVDPSNVMGLSGGWKF